MVVSNVVVKDLGQGGIAIETSDGDDFVTRRNIRSEMVHLVEFSVATEAPATGHAPRHLC